MLKTVNCDPLKQSYKVRLIYLHCMLYCSVVALTQRISKREKTPVVYVVRT